RALNSLIDDYWEADRWDVKVVEGIRQMLQRGTHPLFFYWDIDRPRMISFSIRDAIVDPCGTSPEDIRYAGRRYLSTVDEMESFEVVDTDPDSKTYGELVKRFQGLDRFKGKANAGPEDTDKQEKDMFLGSTLTKPEG